METMFLSNGFVVESSCREFSGIKYYGLDNSPWPIDITEIDNYPKEYADEWNKKDTTTCIDRNGVLLLSEEFSKIYVNKCNDETIDTYTLYCEANTGFPGYNKSWSKKYKVDENFLGYDYAYPGGIYYSCILNDLGRPNFFPNEYLNDLNQYGLFKDIDSVYRFIEKRNDMKKVMPYLTFEEGDFYIYKIYSAPFRNTESFLK
jgi:hypothetical protein